MSEEEKVEDVQEELEDGVNEEEMNTEEVYDSISQVPEIEPELKNGKEVIPGVIYISSIPRGMGPIHVRQRKFRSSKEVKCVRHQESMTSPLDSPLRSVISVTGRQPENLENQIITKYPKVPNDTDGNQSEILLRNATECTVPTNYATLPTPSKRKNSLRSKPGSINNLTDSNENGRIAGRLAESPSVYKLPDRNNVMVGNMSASLTDSPVKPIRSRKKSESQNQPIKMNNYIQSQAVVHTSDYSPAHVTSTHAHSNTQLAGTTNSLVGSRLGYSPHDGAGSGGEAPKGNISEVTIPPSSVTKSTLTASSLLNAEMKSKLSSISSNKNPERSQDRRTTKIEESRPHQEATPNALTSRSSHPTRKAESESSANKKDPALPRMWFVSLDNITPEPVGRTNYSDPVFHSNKV
jgi:hypothetical protein